jgi:hypothetical protein
LENKIIFMKGISKEVVILIVIIVLAFALLYFAWIKGLLPFSVGITEAECHTDIMKECSDMRITNDVSRLQTVLNKCWGYVVKLPSYSNCESCKKSGGMDSCSACCAQDLVGWTA